jgi:hypothetical protein
MSPSQITQFPNNKEALTKLRAQLKERTKAFRSHDFYTRVREKDGKYHCPYEGQVDCTHKPVPETFVYQ